MHFTSGIPDSSWDKQLSELGGHFTQTSHWAAVQSGLGNTVFYCHQPGWMALAILEHGKLGRRIYTPYGPVAKDKKSLTAALKHLRELAKKHSAAYVRMEPNCQVTTKELKKLGLRHAPKSMQPRLTWVKDLTKSEDEIVAEMTATNRNLYRNANKKGLSFHSSSDPNDIEPFLDMIHEVARITGIKPHSDSEYKTIVDTLLPRGAAKIYIAHLDKRPVASAITYDDATTRYYAHGASFSEFRKLHPGSPLLTNMILDAKKDGKTQFDFFGVAPENEPNHPWAGFTRFKQSFGGEYKHYLGSWELPVNKLHYAAFKTIHKVRSSLTK